MEEVGPSRFESIGNAVRRKRSHTSRRPKPESQAISDGREVSPLSATPSLDDARPGSSDENSGGDSNSRRKELSLSQCVSRSDGVEGDRLVTKSRKIVVGLDALNGNSSFKENGDKGRTGSNHRRSSEGVLGPANWKSTSRVKESLEPQKTMALNSGIGGESSGPTLDGSGNENKVKKLKLKVGGLTRTIDANSAKKSSHASEGSGSRHKSSHKDKSDEDNSPLTDKRGGLQGIPWKDFSRVGFSLGREESSMGKTSAKNHSGKPGDKADPVRKSRRASKKRGNDDFEDDEDDEIRYLEKLKNAKFSAGSKEDDDESSRKHRRLSKFSENSPHNLENSSEGKKRSPSEDNDFEEEEERLSDEGRKKKAKKDTADSPSEPKRELTLTTRQRALQSGRDASGVEFPNGLPPAPPKKPKEQLTEVEQQLRKVEAAQKRKMQNEKAAKESEAEAIRRILGQDSSRKKKEDKKKKRVEELAQEKAADEQMRQANSIRVVLGPSGTTVTFPNEMGFPSIFGSNSIGYPAPREKCVGPGCTNPYKYRDSKTKVPLCSLQCYKAVQANPPTAIPSS